MKTAIITKLLFVFCFVAISISPCLSQENIQRNAEIFAELEKQVKKALQEYGFSNVVTDGLLFSGMITMGTPRALPKSIKTVSQKYSCTVTCRIDVLDVKSNTLVCKTEGTFEDIGRTPESARKFALGKVVKPLFKCKKGKKKHPQQLQDTGDIFKTLKQEEAILERHIESLSLFVDGIMDGMEQSI